MGFLGKNEAELKLIAKELEQKTVELENRESDLSALQSKLDRGGQLLEKAKAEFESELADFGSKKSALEKLKIEIFKREAEAKAGFSEQHHVAFKQVIERQTDELDARESDLKSAEARLSEKLKALYLSEGEIARRELEIAEREQKADAGFADKTRVMIEKAGRQQYASIEALDNLRELADKVADERNELELAKVGLLKREQALIASEQKRDAGYSDERAALDQELSNKRTKLECEVDAIREQKLTDLEKNISDIKVKRLAELDGFLNIERERIRAEIGRERDAFKLELEEDRKRLAIERTELERQKGVISAQQSEIEGRNSELEANERVLERREQRLEKQWERKNAELDDRLEEMIQDEREALEQDKQSLQDRYYRLQDTVRNQESLLAAFEQLKKQLGDKDAIVVIREINSKTDELVRLREELATPTDQMKERYEESLSENSRQKALIQELQERIRANDTALGETEDLRRKNAKLSAENSSLCQKAEIFEGAANQAQGELERLRTAYERPAELEARYKEIEMPHIKFENAKQPSRFNIDEVQWLDGIAQSCDGYGLHFNPRILKAFHTSLKTAEWSPLTILAGVSGTGKSELPRLFSHFGGLIFEPLSVQPNWDSQESMLGFFNSIDNKFDAKPLLSFLSQSQKKWVDRSDDIEGYPGLQDAVCLVLLDEMNLAHPELYFAEFLSKLERRRGMKGADVPYLPVSVGAGLPSYQLPLGRNVLWTGTMNQDETTKSLSDKVLDRSMVIHFPRPNELKRRLKLAPLDDNNRGALLHKSSWNSWLAIGSSFSEQTIKPFKSFVEEINDSLAVTGRAIGHRVWQSVEYYMANYPDVRAQLDDQGHVRNQNALDEALHIAFEDQLVQKIMPKLRGIDTVGKSKTECLDRIRAQFSSGIGGNSFDLTEDFDRACELGYGQFIWQSANYLKDIGEGSTDAEINEVVATLDLNPASGLPPEGFRPKDAKRMEHWAKKSPNQRSEWIDNYKKRPQ